MKKKEILKKAIEKAVKNGYFYRVGRTISNAPWAHKVKDGLHHKIIFSHDFAKAFWGEDRHYRVEETAFLKEPLREWEWHLQQMVLEKDPIKYLGKFLEGN